MNNKSVKSHQWMQKSVSESLRNKRVFTVSKYFPQQILRNYKEQRNSIFTVTTLTKLSKLILPVTGQINIMGHQHDTQRKTISTKNAYPVFSHEKLLEKLNEERVYK